MVVFLSFVVFLFFVWCLVKERPAPPLPHPLLLSTIEPTHQILSFVRGERTTCAVTLTHSPNILCTVEGPLAGGTPLLSPLNNSAIFIV